MARKRLTATRALEELDGSGRPFLSLLRYGDIEVEIYRPIEIDMQEPHDRDEIYVVISGSGIFLLGDTREPFEAGEVLFVPAGTVHRFEDFSEDFATWVIFLGKAIEGA